MVLLHTRSLGLGFKVSTNISDLFAILENVLPHLRSQLLTAVQDCRVPTVFICNLQGYFFVVILPF